MAWLGGGLHIMHDAGNLTFSNNTFVNNTTPMVETCAGGAISLIGYTTSYLISKNNWFYLNKGYKGF